MFSYEDIEEHSRICIKQDGHVDLEYCGSILRYESMTQVNTLISICKQDEGECKITIPKAPVKLEYPVEVSDRIIEICKRKRLLRKQFEYEDDVIHKELWAAVHEEHPDVIGKVATLETQFIEVGKVLLTLKDEDASGELPDGLKQALEALQRKLQ